MAKGAKLNELRFALAGGIVLAICIAFTTLFGLVGYFPFSNMLIADMYGRFGYSLSWPKVLLAPIYGFIDTFILVYIFAWIYNKLSK